MHYSTHTAHTYTGGLQYSELTQQGRLLGIFLSNGLLSRRRPLAGGQNEGRPGILQQVSQVGKTDWIAYMVRTKQNN